MPRIIDCVIFGQREMAILALRVDTLCHVVDTFVIAMGTASLSGLPISPFLSPQNVSSLQSRCPSSELHVVIIDTRGLRGKHAQWQTLDRQMSGAVAKARSLGMADDTIVAVTEHDEIPSPALLTECASASWGNDPRMLTLRTAYFYYYHGRCGGLSDWSLGFIANGAALNLRPGTSIHAVRRTRSGDSAGLVADTSAVRHTAAETADYVPMIWLRLFAARIRGVRDKRPDDTPPIDGYQQSGFPAPHFAVNRSWHLSTFMSAVDVLDKVRNGAHPECQAHPFTTYAWQQDAQRTCRHFCRNEVMRPIDDLGQRALPKDAFPAALCWPEYSQFAPDVWCAEHGLKP